MLRVPKSAAYFVLVVLLAAAVYMVYIADGVGQLLPVRQGGEMQEEQGNGEGEDVETIGQDPADWVPNGGKEFFVEYRLERERVRSQELDLLQQMVNNPNVTEESKKSAEARILELQALMETELLVENAIKAQGYENAILIVQQDGAIVIVDAPELSSAEIRLIAQIAAQSTGFRASQISISCQSSK